MRHFGDFLQYIQYIKHYSPHTLRSYRKDLEQFFIFCNFEEESDESAIDHHLIRNWIVELMETGNSARTTNRKLSALKTYFRYLQKEGIVAANPLNKVLSPKPDRKLPVFVKEDQMDHLLDDIEFGDDYSGFRNRMIIETFYNSGIRISELINLKLTDVDMSQLTFKVLGKRNKERIIPLSRNYAESLEGYIGSRESAFSGK